MNPNHIEPTNSSEFGNANLYADAPGNKYGENG